MTIRLRTRESAGFPLPKEQLKVLRRAKRRLRKG